MLFVIEIQGKICSVTKLDVSNVICYVAVNLYQNVQINPYPCDFLILSISCEPKTETLEMQ